MKHIYWIKFRDLHNPIKLEFKTWVEMMDEINKYVNRYGWIEWMNRD